MRVAIDPGHGGSNVGAISPDGLLYERHWALDSARELRDTLVLAGHEVVLTRDADVDVDWQQRCTIAAKFGAHVALSLHLNASASRSARGVQWFSRKEDLAGSRLAVALADEWPPEYGPRVLWSIPKKMDLPHDDWRRRPRTVIDRYACPAVLVECGFITNEHDRLNIITSPEVRQDLWDSVVRAVERTKL